MFFLALLVTWGISGRVQNRYGKLRWIGSPISREKMKVLSTHDSELRLTILFWIIILTVLSSIFHYIDNIAFFSEYPEPTWINTRMVDAFWFVMTPLAPVGYYFIKRERSYVGGSVLLVYGLCNLLTLGHYNYSSFLDISLKIHVLILMEASLGILLTVYVLAFYITASERNESKQNQNT